MDTVHRNFNVECFKGNSKSFTVNFPVSASIIIGSDGILTFVLKQPRNSNCYVLKKEVTIVPKPNPSDGFIGVISLLPSETSLLKIKSYLYTIKLSSYFTGGVPAVAKTIVTGGFRVMKDECDGVNPCP